MRTTHFRPTATLFVAAAVAALTVVGGESQASHQRILIREVFAGTVDQPLAQFVELQMYSSGQTDVAGKTLRVVDSANGAFLYTFPDDVAAGANQTSILIATPAAEDLFGVTGDLTMHAVISAAGGKVCFTGSDDCASWGSFGGSAEGSGTPFNHPAGIARGKSMARDISSGDPTLLDAADDTNDSAADFTHAAPSPRSNAGGGGVADPTPPPSPTATPSPPPAGTPSPPTATPDPGAPTCNGKPATTTTEGTDGDDVFVGTGGDDTFFGGDGDDTVCGLGGNDVLQGFLGDDYIDGGSGDDFLHGCHSSHGRSDAVVCFDDADADDLNGGDGADQVFGHIGRDSLDGGTGYDVVDGGESTDDCAGERYARCETEDPPAPPPACMDGADNDADGYPDDGDPDCSRPRDPTEHIADDPVCLNGNDDDGDGARDYPEDLGCASFSDTDEYSCWACPPPTITASHDTRRGRFGGRVSAQVGCNAGREVVVRRVKRGLVRTVARTRTGEDGSWDARWEGRPGRFVAVAPGFTYHTASGDDPVCSRLRSERFRVERAR